MSNIRRILTLGLALLMALTVAAPALAQGAQEAQIRVAHLSPDAPNVDVSVNGEPVAALQNVPYGTISPYLPLPAGTQQVTVSPAGDSSQPVIDTPGPGGRGCLHHRRRRPRLRRIVACSGLPGRTHASCP